VSTYILNGHGLIYKRKRVLLIIQYDENSSYYYNTIHINYNVTVYHTHIIMSTVFMSNG